MKASSFLSLLASGLALSAFANAQQTFDSSQSLKYIDPQSKAAGQYQECGFDCRYARSSEVISMQVDYLNALLLSLRAEKNDTGKLELLGSFCFGSENATSCESRFNLYAVNVLARSQRLIAENQEMQRNLVDQSGIGGVKGTQNSGGGTKAIPLPYVPKVQALQAEGSDVSERLRYLTSEAYVNEVKATLQAEPSQSDFVVLKEIPQDPRDPKSKKVWVPERKPDGSFVLDAVAYRRAKHAYEVAQKDFQKNTGIAPKADFSREIDIRSRAIGRDISAFVANKKDARVDKLKAIYNVVHDGVANNINKKLAKGDGAQRATASGKSSGAGNVDLVAPPGNIITSAPYTAQEVHSFRESAIQELPPIVDQPGMNNATSP